MAKLIGKVIKKNRQWRELTLSDLAKASGIHENYLGAIERGSHDPSTRILGKIADSLNMPLSQVFKEAEEAEAEEIEQKPINER